MTRDYSRLEGTAFSRARVGSLAVMVVGAGALGNEVIKQLALLGVGRLLIVDRDRIERSNLTRSVLFCTADIERHIAAGTPKSTFAAARAAEINRDVVAQSIVGEVADVGLTTFQGVGLIFGCLDNELARLELGWAALRANRPMIDGGLSVTAPANGMVAVYPGASGPCYLCRLAPERRRQLLWELQGREDPCWIRERQLEAAGAVSTTPLTAAVVAALQVERGLRTALDDVPRRNGTAHRVSLHPAPAIDNRVFEISGSCPLHDARDVIADVMVCPGRSSSAWRVSDLLDEVAPSGASATLALDWPLTVRARCAVCGHEWEPMVRRARFRREVCPACRAAAPIECESIAEVVRESRWADRTLAALGLPPGHVHTIVNGDESSPRLFVVAGDDPAAWSERR